MSTKLKKPLTLDAPTLTRLKSAEWGLLIGRLEPKTMNWLQDRLQKVLNGDDAQVVFGQTTKRGPASQRRDREFVVGGEVHAKRKTGLSYRDATKKVAAEMGLKVRTVQRIEHAFNEAKQQSQAQLKAAGIRGNLRRSRNRQRYTRIVAKKRP